MCPRAARSPIQKAVTSGTQVTPAVVVRRVGLGHRPCGRAHRVPVEPAQCVDAQVSVDQHEPLALVDHDHRHLLPDLGDRRDQAAATITAADPKIVVPELELVQVHLHASTLNTRDPDVEAGP